MQIDKIAVKWENLKCKNILKYPNRLKILKKIIVINVPSPMDILKRCEKNDGMAYCPGLHHDCHSEVF
jgi:hypothetical protein